MDNIIKIILADDELLFRKGIAFLLEREPNFKVIYEASDGSDLVNYLENDPIELPDLILIDLKMPLLNGVEATKRIHSKFPEIKIIALTSYETKPFVLNMIQEGASSYLVKNTSPKEVVKTINEVIAKGFYYNDMVMEIIYEGISSGNKKVKCSIEEDYLTSREKEVLKLICMQHNTNEIAEKLFISPRTVDGHRNNLLLKTEARNIAGLVVYAIQNKIVDVEQISQRF
ncbi:response regulator transcription factor [Flavobacterium sp. NRK F10]|uniref:response regulator transcription factor n=1 Tax=Flavobacterium sp. NRK F10 TaxID=2954931 RepID=UPI002091703A|nr:response regulator transcription factor [Flavobacterium sp. NRK F10]MCO6173920.1 response regulator transcription factor [Flavobacterium sp. NRK F10]